MITGFRDALTATILDKLPKECFEGNMVKGMLEKIERDINKQPMVKELELSDLKEIFIHPAVEARFEPHNRSVRRQMVFEYNRIVKHLPDFDGLFVNDLFDESMDVDYNTLYTFHLTNFTNVLEWVQKTVEPKFWDLNEMYFANCFKPMEKVRQ